MKILFISTEAAPFAKSGGLGDVVGALPKELKKQNTEARVVLPMYKTIKEKYFDKMKLIAKYETKVAWRTKYCGLYEMEYEGIIFYFIDNEGYFKRDAYYGYFDDGERFAFFSRACLDMLNHIEYKPDILHCSEWQTALVPIYLKTIYRGEKEYDCLRTVFTIHNIEYQGKYGNQSLTDLFGIPQEYKNLVEYDGCINLMKGAVVACDQLTTVSPTYAGEIQYSFYGRGIENIIKENSYKLTGILNGIDNTIFNPWFDKNLVKRYSGKNRKNKAENKAALQKELAINVDNDIPIIGMITRLTSHKGIDLLINVFDELMTENIQFVILGSGDKKYEAFFRSKVIAYPGRIGARIQFATGLASRIYAGADMFLMPSISEPCGLAQMISAKYGTIPIVRATGGLYDSIKPYNPIEKTGNGITFGQVNAQDMLGAIKRAIKLYWDKPEWKILQSNCFNSNFSWKTGAEQYINVYKKIVDDTGETI